MDDEKKIVMTPEEFVEEMKDIDNRIKYVDDKHRVADRLMCRLLESLGYGNGVEVFEDMEKWYA